MKDISQVNKSTYSSASVIERYSDAIDLEIVEKEILLKLKSQLADFRMLDLGVGAGRTTAHFAPLVKNYIGIDYSSAMIEICRLKFPQFEFKVADARAMNSFEDNSFDFILFSFNGIDYMGHEDRAKALNEIKRILKFNGKLCLSSHNTLYLENFLKIPLCKNPIRQIQFIRRYYAVKSLIKENQTMDMIRYTTIADGGEDFRVKTYYINPQKQLCQLKDLGFKDVEVYSEKTGKIIKENELNNKSNDRWFYYLCNKGN